MTHSTSNPADISALMAEISQQNFPDSTLYVVATPIGNIGDISLRALNILSIADAVACEDTRNTAQLLARYHLSKTLIAAHQHNEREAADKLIARLQRGERIALVSDAGTPGVSDPGARIVDAVRNAGLRVMPMPCLNAPSDGAVIRTPCAPPLVPFLTASSGSPCLALTTKSAPILVASANLPSSISTAQTRRPITFAY